MRRTPLVLCSLAIAGLPASSASAADTAEHTLGVSGQGLVELVPDVGSFEASVERTAPTSSAARNAANTRLARIVARLRAPSIPREDITTTSISLSRERTRNPRTKRLRVRYRASGSFAVRVADGTKTGRAIDLAAGAGATGIDGPSFSFSAGKRTEGRQAAEKSALADARGRADAAAASQGQKVVGVQSIELDPSGTSEPSAVQDSAASPTAGSGSTGKRVAPTPVLAGREEFTSSVRVVYLIAPAG
ncbi:SIMPL domain-containing protein [Patulibacter minatonensis]|uniref:SIMPL domain-containing protein n=1 Tax=Patulibacter minatonensis TaxID=298163 RepID=UPI00047D644B|nr:SIMPL domain-containing protein [Patulibacter minatonensis]